MNENYLDDLYNELKKTPNVSFDLDIDAFKEKMVSDDNYRNKVYSVVQSRSNNPKFKGVDPKSFYTSVLESSKKKSQSEIGSQATQPTDGSENAQFSPQGLRPEDQQVQEEQQVFEQPKRVIYRGEGAREALETQFAPQVKQEVKKATVTEATKPIAKEMGEIIKPTSKVQKLADLNYMNENPDDFNSTYYNVFKDEAEKSGDPEKYSKDLKDKYANDFIDDEFKEEYNIASELKYIEDKMKKEISSLKSNPNANTPQGQEYIKNKIAEYSQLIQSKTAKLDEVRKASNQKYQQRIDEINQSLSGNLSVSDIRNAEDLIREKDSLMRRMKLIKLAENPEGLKQEVGDVEYNKIPGATADEKLNNYLNTRLTIYDQFKEDALDAALDRSRFYGEKKDRADKVYNSYLNLKGELKDLYYLSALKRYANPEDRSNFLEAVGEGFLGSFAEGALNFDDVGKKHSENLQKIAQEAGIQYGDEDKSFIEYTSEPAAPWSSEWWGNMAGTSSAFMAELALTRKPTNAVLKAAGSAIKAAPQMTKIAQGALSRYDKLGKTGQKFVNTVFNAAEEGAYFEGANQILHDGESSELSFLTGFTGGLLAAPVNALLKKAGGVAFDSFKKGATQEITKDALTAERAAVLESLGAQKDEVKTLLSQFVKPTAGKDAVYMISGTFGKQSPKVIDLLEKVGTHLIARPTGEVAQEFGEELANIYQETSNFEEFKKEFSARFPDADAATQFVVASYMMGVGFGGGNFVGDVFMKKSKQGYDALTPEQKKVADKAIAEADKEIKDKESEVLNEQELNTPQREKSKEETDWDNTRVELEGKISQSDSQISALDNIKKKIYEKYGITDPKTQDISGLSNEDAIKIETINSEIQKEKKAKSKEEINLSIHEDNKPVIEEVEEAPNAVHADQLIDKNKQDAVQEPSTEEVLPREQGETTETGGQPQGMGPSVQGQEVTQEGQEVKQENVEATKPISQKIIDSKMNDLKKRLESSLEFAKANNIPEDKSPDVASAREQIAKLESNPAEYLEELYNAQKNQPLDAKYISDLKQAIDELKSTPTPKTQEVKEEKTSEGAGTAIEEKVQPKTDEFTGTSKRDLELKRKYAKDAQKRRALEQATKAASVLKGKTRIVLHENSDDYKNAMNNLIGTTPLDSEAGSFNYSEDGKIQEIHIDLSKANDATVFHEAAHAVLFNAFGDNAKLFQQFKDKLKPLLANSTVAELENFANNANYVAQGVTAEEFLAEFAGQMASQGKSIPKSTLQKIAQLINDFVFTITKGKLKPFQNTADTVQVIDFFNSMLNSFASGQELDPLLSTDLTDLDFRQLSIPKLKSKSQISNNKKEEFKKMLEKKRPDLKERGLIDSVIDDVEKFGEENSQNKKGNPKLEKLAFHWIYNANVILPEDSYKIVDAEKVATKNKVDPFAYDSPEALMESFQGSVKERPIDPDTVPTFTNKTEIPGTDIVVYDVADTKEGQADVRKAIDTNWGKDANPWCLAARVDGNLDRAWELWSNTYNAIDKKIAFKNGKLLCFRASGFKNDNTWWDRMDRNTEGVSDAIDIGDGKKQNIGYDYNGKILSKGIIRRKTKNKIEEWMADGTEIYVANINDQGKFNGSVKSWLKKGLLFYEENYKDGILDGVQTRNDLYGNLDKLETYKNGELILVQTFYEPGKMLEEQTYKNGEKNGLWRDWDNEGFLENYGNYKNGKRDGLFSQFHKGKLVSERIYEDGREIKLTEYYYNKDAQKTRELKEENIQKKIEYKMGDLWIEDRITYYKKDGTVDYVETINEDGTIYSSKETSADKESSSDIKSKSRLTEQAKEEIEAEADPELESIINEFKAAEQMEGIDKLDKMNELKEKYGEIYEKINYINSNFDELVEKFNAVRICNFEP